MSIDNLAINTLRFLSAEAIQKAKSGHPGLPLGAAPAAYTLWSKYMKHNPADSKWADRDRFVLSKGHTAPGYYSAMAQRGYFPVEELLTLRHVDSRLQGHPCSKETPGVEASTGPLGAGYPFALGLALSDMHDGVDAYTYAILGDGEINEGVVWETCMNASKFKADRLISILDWNGVQLDGTTEQIMPMGDIELKFKAFGYNTIVCDGHNVAALSAAIETAKSVKGVPSIILAKTVKGKGISFMEGKNTWHGAPVKDADYEAAMKELGGVQ